MLDLTTTINRTLNLDTDSQNFIDTFDATILYVAHVDGIKEYHEALAKGAELRELGFTASKFRLENISLSSYVMQNLGYFILHLCKCRPLTQENAKCYKDFGVSRDDAKRVYQGLTKRKLRAIISRTTKYNSLTKDDVSAVAFKATRIELIDLHQELVKYVKFKVYKKLAFLLKPFNMDPADFENELTENVIRAYNRSMPNTQSFLHKANYLRRTTHNRTLNIIKHYTTKKKERIMNVGTDNGDGAKFIFRTESENQLPTDVEGNVLGFDAPTLETRAQEEHRKVVSLSLERLISKNLGTKRGMLLQLIAGKDVPEFDAYLRKRNILRTDIKSHDDILFSKGRDIYFGYIADFLSVKPQSVNTYIDSLKGDL